MLDLISCSCAQAYSCFDSNMAGLHSTQPGADQSVAEVLVRQRHLANAAIRELHCAVTAVKGITRLTVAANGGPSGGEAASAAQLQQVQQAYLAHTAELRHLVQSLIQLQPQLEAVVAAGVRVWVRLVQMRKRDKPMRV
jgi:hypothetical protein